MCVCVLGYGCVFFLWVCGILAHNSCSSQVTAFRSHAHIWHSFPDMITIHLPLLGLDYTPNISIIPEWNWSSVPEMSNPLTPLLLLQLAPPLSIWPHCLFLMKPIVLVLLPTPSGEDFEGLIGKKGILWSGPFSPWVSCLCLCRCDGVIWQQQLSTDLLLC